MRSGPRHLLPRRVTLCAAVNAVAAVSLGQINTTWRSTVGTSQWSIATNWSGNVVPNSSGSTLFNAFVDGGAATNSFAFVLNGTFTISNLGISSGDSVLISNNGGLNLAGVGGVGSISNAGTLSITGAPAQLGIANASISLGGGGTLTMLSTAAAIAGLGIATLNNQNNLIAGNGSLGNNTLAIINGGTIAAGNALTLIVDPSPGGFVNTGILRALSGATLGLSGNGGGAFNSTAGSISILGGATLVTAGGASLTAGDIALDGAWILGAATVDAGRVTGGGNIDQTGTSTLTHFRIADVQVHGSSTLTIRAGGGTVGTSRTSSLLVSSVGTLTARLDLNDHAMVIDYDMKSPFNTIATYTSTGYAGGAWDGPGLVSTAAASAKDTGLGFAEATDIFASFPANFAGVPVDATSILVFYTLYGDSNLDGTVSIADFSLLASNFNTGFSTLNHRRWHDGDYNYDGEVDIADFAELAANYNETTSSRVPEPAAMMLGLILRRRRRRNFSSRFPRHFHSEPTRLTNCEMTSSPGATMAGRDVGCGAVTPKSRDIFSAS